MIFHPHEVLDADEVMRRFPQFQLRGDEVVYYEPGGGYVRPEACVDAQLALARSGGVAVRANTQVTSIARDGAGVCVATAAGENFAAAEVVLAAGAWSPRLAGRALAPHMQITRQVLHWFPPADPAVFAPGRCPVYIWTYGDRPEEGFYGFPVPPGTKGVKIAMEQYLEFAEDPDHLRRDVTPEEVEHKYSTHLQTRMPGLLPGALRSVVCPYTMTRDGDFLVQRLPENDRVLLVSACSGHGFKHSAGLGEAVAEMVTTGTEVSALAGFAGDVLSRPRRDRARLQPSGAAPHQRAR